VIDLKKGEEALVITTFSNTRSMITFIVAIFVLFGLFVIIHSYSNLVEERTIVVRSDTDLPMAKQKLQEQTQKLQQGVSELRAIVS